MFNNLFILSLPAGNLILRGIIVFLSVLLLLRIGGKRQLGQMGATEFVSILLISNAVQNAMNGGDNSLLGGLILASVLIFLSTGISFLTYRHSKFRAIFEGIPTLLIHNGKIIEKHLRQERMTSNELHTLLRKQGVHHFEEVKTAVLESDGTLSITRVSETN